MITRAELLALAKVSQLELTPEELETMPARLAEVLQYAAMVTELAHHADVVAGEGKNSNVLREDQPIAFDAERILAQAPEREGGYFVVPRILEVPTDAMGAAR